MGYTNFENLPSQNTPFSSTVLKQMQVGLMEMVFPIGSTYITQNNTNPSAILEFGTWERVKGKVLVGLDENDQAFNTIGKIGGEKTHTLTVQEMPSHDHPIEHVATSSEGRNYRLYERTITDAATGDTYRATIDTNLNGGSQPHNILQPYQVIGYMWIRTA